MLAGIGVDVIQADQGVQVSRGLRDPAGRIIGRGRVAVFDDDVGACQGDFLQQAGMSGHFRMEPFHHGLPETVIALRRRPVPVRLVEDDEMADAVETFLLDQPVQIVHAHLHPGVIRLQGPVRRIELAIDHFDAPVLTEGEQFQQRSGIAFPVIGSPVVIQVLSADHAADESRPQEVYPGEEGLPVRVGDFRPPGRGLVVRVPFHPVSQIG